MFIMHIKLNIKNFTTTVFVYLLFVLIRVDLVLSALCEFPAWSVTRPGEYWNYDHRLSGENWKVTIVPSMVSVHVFFDNVQDKVYVRLNCTEKLAENFYRVHVWSAVKYTPIDACLDVLKRSDNVFQLKRKFMVSGGPCERNQLELIPKPFTINKPRSHFLPSPVLHPGAYMVTRGTATGIVDTGILEVECQLGEGLRLSFPSIRSIPTSFGWEQDVRLMTTDTWSDDGITSTLLAREFYKPLWCMQTTSVSGRQINISITHDMRCDMITQQTKLTLTKIENICDDQFVNCTKQNYCENPRLARLCGKQCKTCERKSIPSCEIENGKGIWGKFIATNDVFNVEKLEIAKDGLTHAELGKFSCSEKLDSTIYALKSPEVAGCPIRYNCLEVDYLNQAVLKYRLGQGVSGRISKYDICSSINQKDDPIPFSNKLRSESFKNIISEDATKRAGNKCGGFGNFSIIADGCNATLSMVNSDCSALSSIRTSGNCRWLSSEMDCLAAVTDSDQLANDDLNITSPIALAIFVPKNKPENASCWIRNSKEKLLYSVLHSANCNLKSVFSVEGKFRSTISNFEGIKQDRCIYPTPPTAPPGPNKNTGGVGLDAGGVIGIILLVAVVCLAISLVVYKYMYWRKSPAGLNYRHVVY